MECLVSVQGAEAAAAIFEIEVGWGELQDLSSAIRPPFGPRRPQYPYPRILALKWGHFRRAPRKNNALRKKWSEGYIAKEK